MMTTCTVMTTDDAYLYSDPLRPILLLQGLAEEVNKALQQQNHLHITCCTLKTHTKKNKIQSNGIYIYMAQIHNTVSLT